jgi:mRNA-degrading endonuclease RelE of RelBE toxin-antitoxin system
MKIYFSEHFRDNVDSLPENIRKILSKKISYLSENINHPSLGTKKIQGQKYIFEAAISKGIRLTWQYYKDGILLRKVDEHNNTLGNP